jgi:hypothetical protein
MTFTSPACTCCFTFGDADRLPPPCPLHSATRYGEHGITRVHDIEHPESAEYERGYSAGVAAALKSMGAK